MAGLEFIRWGVDPTYLLAIGRIPFLIREVNDSIVCYGKACDGKLVPLEETDIIVAMNLSLTVEGHSVVPPRACTDQKEQLHLKEEKEQPRTKEINKTIIDFSKGYVLDTHNIHFIDENTLRIIGQGLSLDITDIETLKNHIKEKGKGYDWKSHRSDNPPLPNLPNIILIHEFSFLYSIWLVSDGYLKVREVRQCGGALLRRELYHENDKIYYFSEDWTEDGDLEFRTYFDDKGMRVGPCYDHKSGFTYFLNDIKVSEKEWQNYITKYIMRSISLPKELCLLVAHYVF